MVKNINNLLEILRIFYIVTEYKIYKTKCIKLHFCFRLCSIILYFVIHPIKFFYHKNNDYFLDNLEKCLIDLGPIYIKFGQAIATRTDFIGTSLSNKLSLLQDSLPIVDFDKIEHIIQSNLHTNYKKIFRFLNKIPIASASIAQVHKGQLYTGEYVAIKILKPNVKKEYEKNIQCLYLIAKIIHYFSKNAKRMKFINVVDIFQECMEQELNLSLEAAAGSKFADYLSKNDKVIIPKIYWHLTNENIAVLEWIDGITLIQYHKYHNHKLYISYNIIYNLMFMFLDQVFKNGFFHADLHQGNIMICKDSKIGLIDFGIVSVLPNQDRVLILKILYYIIQGDYYKVSQLHQEGGYISSNTNLILFERYCRAAIEPIMSDKKHLNIGSILKNLFHITEHFGMTVQPQLILLQKNVIMLEGIISTLDSTVNTWNIVKLWIKKNHTIIFNYREKLHNICDTILHTLENYCFKL